MRSSHLENNNYFEQSHHGFVKGKLHLTNLHEDAHSPVDEGEPVGLMRLDIQQAFDKVPIETGERRLVHKIGANYKCTLRFSF